MIMKLSKPERLSLSEELRKRVLVKHIFGILFLGIASLGLVLQIQFQDFGKQNKAGVKITLVSIWKQWLLQSLEWCPLSDLETFSSYLFNLIHSALCDWKGELLLEIRWPKHPT